MFNWSIYTFRTPKEQTVMYYILSKLLLMLNNLNQSDRTTKSLNSYFEITRSRILLGLTVQNTYQTYLVPEKIFMHIYLQYKGFNWFMVNSPRLVTDMLLTMVKELYSPSDMVFSVLSSGFAQKTLSPTIHPPSGVRPPFRLTAAAHSNVIRGSFSAIGLKFIRVIRVKDLISK